MKKIMAIIIAVIIMCMASACDGISLGTFIDYGSSSTIQSSSEAAEPTSALEAYKEANRKVE